MRLTELNAKFIGSGGDGVYKADGSPVPRRDGVGVIMDCPCGASGEERHKLYVPFSNPLDGGPAIEKDPHPVWHRTGDTIEALTLNPSVQRMDGCRWHGFIRNGEAVSC